MGEDAIFWEANGVRVKLRPHDEIPGLRIYLPVNEKDGTPKDELTLEHRAVKGVADFVNQAAGCLREFMEPYTTYSPLPERFVMTMLSAEDFAVTGAPDWAVGTTRQLPGTAIKTLVYKPEVLSYYYPDRESPPFSTILTFEAFAFEQYTALRDSVWEYWRLYCQAVSTVDPEGYQTAGNYSIRELWGLPAVAEDGTQKEVVEPFTAYELATLSSSYMAIELFRGGALRGRVQDFYKSCNDSDKHNQLPRLFQASLCLAAIGITHATSQAQGMGPEEAFQFWQEELSKGLAGSSPGDNTLGARHPLGSAMSRLREIISNATGINSMSWQHDQWPAAGQEVLLRTVPFDLNMMLDNSLTMQQLISQRMNYVVHELGHLIGPPFANTGMQVLSEGTANFLALHCVPDSLPAIADTLLNSRPVTWGFPGDLHPIDDLLWRFIGQDPNPVPFNRAYASAQLVVEGVTERARQRYSRADGKVYGTMEAFVRWTDDICRKCEASADLGATNKIIYEKKIFDAIAELVELNSGHMRYYGMLQREGQAMIRHYLKHGMDSLPPVQGMEQVEVVPDHHVTGVESKLVPATERVRG